MVLLRGDLMKVVVLNTTKSTTINEIVAELNIRGIESIVLTSVPVQESVYFGSLVYPLNPSAAQVARTATKKRGPGAVASRQVRMDEAKLVERIICHDILLSDFVWDQTFLLAATSHDALAAATICQRIPELFPVLGIAGMEQVEKVENMVAFGHA